MMGCRVCSATGCEASPGAGRRHTTSEALQQDGDLTVKQGEVVSPCPAAEEQKRAAE